jgi:hypothetical protein
MRVLWKLEAEDGKGGIELAFFYARDQADAEKQAHAWATENRRPIAYKLQLQTGGFTICHDTYPPQIQDEPGE